MKTNPTIVPIGSRQRNTWIDGIKGIACLQVFFSHFMTVFYPAYYLAGVQGVHTNGNLERQFAYSPFNLLFEGEMYVAIFCLASGIFLTLKVMNMKQNPIQLSEVIVGRYFRLALPVIPVGVIVWIMSKLHLFTNVAASAFTGSTWAASLYTEPIGLVQMLSSVIVKMWFFGDDTISTAFWMLYQMFYGSILAILLGAIHWKMPKKSVLIYAFITVCLIPRHDYVIVFAIGAIFAWMIKENTINILSEVEPTGKLATFVGIICITVGILVAGYPIQLEPQGFYAKMNLGFNDLWRVIGATLVVYGIWNIKGIQKALSAKPLQRLGSVCYELYIIHIPIMFSAGCGLFLLLNSWGVDYNVACPITFVITFALTIVLSFLYSKYISKYCVLLEKKIMAILVK